ncbi:transcription termination factor 2 isoform X2 [Pieris brassicae]|uniref:transcription termination factor 2 isoform X2 n=1 Tax=Pieris brassicae TaxID=7116 RepID=UPI001E66159F|nr:transcription termination factor 2 isoform X2 [Pieris brassicae]
MENSFFEYRDITGVAEVSDGEIENSVLDESYAPKKTPAKKNQTIFIPESDETAESDDEQRDISIVNSSDEDAPLKLNAFMSPKKLVLSSSDDESLPGANVSKASIRSSRSSDQSFIGHKKKKRILQLDSDTDNSIIIEHNKSKKVACLKPTPAKIIGKKALENMNMSYDSIRSDVEYDDDQSKLDQTDDDDKSDKENAPYNSNRQSTLSTVKDYNDEKSHEASIVYESDDTQNNTRDYKIINTANKEVSLRNDNDSTNNIIHNNDSDTEEYEIETSEINKNNDSEGDKPNDNDDDHNDDELFMSRATRMSIIGFVPKDNESDDSDYIESGNSTHSHSSASNELPDSSINVSQMSKLRDDSRISCSPFSSPKHDKSPKSDSNEVVDLTQLEDPDDLKSRIQGKLKGNFKENIIDDEVTIIDTKPEVIALSSDDDDDVKPKKSPKSPKEGKHVQQDMKQYIIPSSYPNQVVYVKRHVRENEASKLNGLREDLQNVKYLLETMDLDTLPDGGSRLIERLSILEDEVRRQGEKVARMVVEEEPSASGTKQEPKDEKVLTWDDLQNAGNAVQPRMFGKQAMSTHMAERTSILESLRDLYESLASCPSEDKHAPQPRLVATKLMPHQLHALAWLLWREKQRPCGGILADDMGLGKTISMISLMATDKETSIDRDDDEEGRSKLVHGGTLVVCPASLMQQWAGEVQKHCTSNALLVCLHHGAKRATQAPRLAQYDLVLTTYNILQRESEKNGVLTRILWRRLILDEAHAVRNYKSLTSVAVSALKGKRRWALTGTPLHNKDLDLFALIKFLRCSPFDELHMWKKWIDNKSMGGQERLTTIMRGVMLRRTKVQLQEKGQLTCLPKREAHSVEVTLNKDEMNVYQKVLVFSKTLFAQYLHQRAEKQEDVRGGYVPSQKDSAYHKMHKKMVALQGAAPVKSHEILVLLLRLRQVCCHCGLIAVMLDSNDIENLQEDLGGQDLLAELNKLSLEDSKTGRKKLDKDDSDSEEETKESTTVTEAIRSVMSSNNPVFKLDRQSSKIKAVMECLNENVLSKPGEKAVVVSQWTSVLSLVERELKAMNVQNVTLSGKVSVPKRPPLIDALNDPQSKVRVMLLSLCAGGVGLNLCGANHLLLLDPHWNPQLEEQAQDRIYRVGQKKDVHIYRFMCVETVEQSIRKLQEAKLKLAENVLTGARHNASKLTIDDLKELFNMNPKRHEDDDA